jgi:uncharacterized protein
MTAAILVLAKQPVAGQVKTRLCPPCSPEQAATLAGAALADTLTAARASTAGHRVLALSGGPAGHQLPGFAVLPQRGAGLGERIAAAFADAAAVLPAGTPVVLVGMDTPQLTGRLLDRCVAGLSGVDGALGMAEDGGWWALGLRDAAAAAVVAGVPMSTPDTGRSTAAALRGAGLRLAELPVLRDVDRWADALAVAGAAPDTRFAAAVSRVGAGLAGVPA